MNIVPEAVFRCPTKRNKMPPYHIIIVQTTYTTSAVSESGFTL